MGLTTPITALESALADFDDRYAELCALDSLEADDQVSDDILRTAFVLRDQVTRHGEMRPLPVGVTAAMDTYDHAAWNCTPTDPYGGENHQALVNAAMAFIDSLTTLIDSTKG